MLSLAARARTALRAPQTFSYPVRRIASTRRNDPKKDKDKPPTLVDNAPGWNEDLATPSEAFVKADREPMTLDPGAMQKKTVDYVQSHHHRHINDSDPLADPEVARTHATYAREEIGGPLSNAGTGMGEFEGVVGNDDLGPDHADGQAVEPNGRVVNRRVVDKSRPGSGAGQAT